MRWLFLSFLLFALVGCASPESPTTQETHTLSQAAKDMIRSSVQVFHQRNADLLDARIAQLEQFQAGPIRVESDRVTMDGTKPVVILHWTENPMTGLREASRVAIGSYIMRDKKIRDLQDLIDRGKWLEAFELFHSLNKLLVY